MICLIIIYKLRFCIKNNTEIIECTHADFTIELQLIAIFSSA